MGTNGHSVHESFREAARFARMAKRFDHHPRLSARFSALARDAAKRGRKSDADLAYFRVRLASEQAAAMSAPDARVRCAHLEMADRYQARISTIETGFRSACPVQRLGDEGRSVSRSATAHTPGVYGVAPDLAKNQ
jgi:hypothetical protein